MARSEATEEDSLSRREDRLLVRPRPTVIVGSALLGLFFLAAAAAVWVAGVTTYRGQKFDDWVWQRFYETYSKANILNSVFANSHLVIGVSIAIIAVSLVIVLIRRRWQLLLQMAVFGALSFITAWSLKRVLIRPVIDRTISNPANSAPSGHTALAMAAAVILVMCVPRALRALCALAGTAFVDLVAFSVMAEKWHRPTDVLMSILLVAGLGLIVLAFSHGSGMDQPGKRFSSVGVQVCSSILITAGIMMEVYVGYMVWQLWDYILNQPIAFARQVNITIIFAVLGCSFISFGVLAAFRQATAAPLSRSGMVGAPPAPPKQWEN